MSLCHRQDAICPVLVASKTRDHEHGASTRGEKEREKGGRTLAIGKYSRKHNLLDRKKNGWHVTITTSFFCRGDIFHPVRQFNQGGWKALLAIYCMLCIGCTLGLGDSKFQMLFGLVVFNKLLTIRGCGSPP